MSYLKFECIQDRFLLNLNKTTMKVDENYFFDIETNWFQLIKKRKYSSNKHIQYTVYIMYSIYVVF